MAQLPVFQTPSTPGAATDTSDEPDCAPLRSMAAMATAIAEGSVDIIGLARPMAVEPDLPERLLTGQEGASGITPRQTGITRLARLGLLEIVWYMQQLQRLGAGRAPASQRSPWTALSIACLSTFRDLLCRSLRLPLARPSKDHRL